VLRAAGIGPFCWQIVIEISRAFGRPEPLGEA
jgi:hypothetical protein